MVYCLLHQFTLKRIDLSTQMLISCRDAPPITENIHQLLMIEKNDSSHRFGWVIVKRFELTNTYFKNRVRIKSKVVLVYLVYNHTIESFNSYRRIYYGIGMIGFP